MADAVGKPEPRRAAYGGRFALAYLLVVLLFGGVVVLFAYLVSQNESPAWSGYRPHGKGIDRAQDIANHVSGQYREDGVKIAAVDAQPPVVGQTPVDAIATARPQTGGVGGGYERVEPANATVLYVFCGLDQRCSVPGPATDEREQLLRRESLELALYTFKYMNDVDSVVTLLPPIERQKEAVYLKRNSIGGLLHKPLARTLPARAPFEPGQFSDVRRSERLTTGRFYSYDFQELPNGLGVLVLTKRPAQ